MKGRLEHQLKTEKHLKDILKDQPQFLKDYYYHLVASAKENTTARTYLIYIINFLSYEKEKGKIINQVTDIAEIDVVEYMADLRYVNKEKQIKQASHAYRAVVWSALNSFFKFYTKQKIIESNPMENIERDSAERDNVKRIALSPEEIQKVIKSVYEGIGSEKTIKRQEQWRERDISIILLLLLTGMRVTALTEINLEDVDFENKIVTIIDKNEKHHVYPLENIVLDHLHKWIDQRIKILNYDLSEGALFISNRKTRITDKAVRDLVKKYTSVLETPITPHKFRSTYGTNLYNQTHDLYMVQKCMGHSDIHTTTRYIKDDGEERKVASKIMSDLIKL